MLDEDARFLEGTGVEEELDPLARGEPAFGVELLDPLLAATKQGFLLAPPQLFDGVSGSQVRGLLADLLRVLTLIGTRSLGQRIAPDQCNYQTRGGRFC